MSQALYRKYRSRSLDEIVGQEHITSLLSRAIAAGHINHAYLLTGPKGVGKTSIARILAHEINGLPYTDETNHLDIIEIDAASNNSVEDVRELRERVHLAPVVASKKVYIIDEVHMLSKQAFNALLKTLEEPPEHIVFVLATTDADKLPSTIISRVQRFNFRAISGDDIARHLRTIADKESIAIDDEALQLLAEYGEGSFRDSIGLLDQLRHSTDQTITTSDIETMLGIASRQRIIDIVDAYRAGNLALLTNHLHDLEQSGTQAGLVITQIIATLLRTLPSHPEDMTTLDRLADNSMTHYPYIRLLAVLARFAQTPTISTALPLQSTASAPSSVPTTPSESATPKTTPAPKTDTKGQPPQDAPPTVQPEAEFAWDELLSAVAPDAALSTLLKKSGYTFDGRTLTIYAGNKFNAEQLKGTKQSPKLHAALAELKLSDILVVIEPHKKPSNDAETAAIAAIMGGGEEVPYDA